MTLHEYGIASWKGRLRIVLGALGSDALVFPDETIAAAMTSVVARLGAKSTRVIPIASNIERSALEIDRRAVRADWKVPAGALAVGWFGLLTHEKGALALIEALKAIRGRRQMVLVIVGDALMHPAELLDPGGSMYLSTQTRASGANGTVAAGGNCSTANCQAGLFCVPGIAPFQSAPTCRVPCDATHLCATGTCETSAFRMGTNLGFCH